MWIGWEDFCATNRSTRTHYAALCTTFLCCGREAPAGEEKLAVQGETADAAASAPAAAAKTPRIEFWGDYRWLYGKARMELPSVGKKQDVYLSTRRFRIAPTIHLGEGWSVSGMLEDMRYDKDTIAGAPISTVMMTTGADVWRRCACAPRPMWSERATTARGSRTITNRVRPTSITRWTATRISSDVRASAAGARVPTSCLHADSCSPSRDTTCAPPARARRSLWGVRMTAHGRRCSG